MGKKKRILINPKKFGKKHFEFLDNLDGTNDNVISSTTVKPTLRTLNLVDNGDQTVKLSAELFGTGSLLNAMKIYIQQTGGLALAADITSTEVATNPTAGATGFVYSTAKPAIQGTTASPFVFPAGQATIKAIVYKSSDAGTLTSGADLARRTFTERITVAAAPIGVTSALLSGALSSTGNLTISTTSGLVGTGAQHGSGSGVGSSQVYAIASSVGHGFHVAASGSLTGSLTLAHHAGFATTPNGHGSSSVQLLASASVAALASQTLTVTLTPLDVNGALSSTDSVATTLSVPFA